MPFLAYRNGETVTPREVPDDAVVTCIDCGEEMRVRGGEFVARHFWHPHSRSPGGCSGGESETHRLLKSIVIKKLKQVFEVSEAGVERQIGNHIVDVYALFDERDVKYGKGIACEVQYRHEDKDIVHATKDYLREGFSVCWIEPAHIDGKDIELSDPEWYYPGNLRKYIHEDFQDQAHPDSYSERSEGWDVPIGEVDRIPERCPHYNGPDHWWTDYGWAQQGKAKCNHCGAIVDKERLEHRTSPFDSYTP